jgi:hypothetical protein
MPEDPAIRARITAALNAVDAAVPLSSGDLLRELRNPELLDVEERLVLILGRVREEIDNRELN